MKTLVFSDTHLKKKFDQAKYDFLFKAICEHEWVVINGDFWDGYFVSFDEFVTSKWQGLFPKLLERNALYIYGNHDPKEWMDERTNLFSSRTAKRYRTILHGKSYELTHGHEVMPGYIEWGMPPKPLRVGVDHFYRLEGWGVKLFGSQFRNLYWYRNWDNRNIRRRVARECDADYFLCGHTHQAGGDGDGRYLNSGCVEHGVGTYISISGNGPRVITSRY